MFWISSALILIVVIVALFPGLFTQVPPNNDCLLANSNAGPTEGHPLGFTKRGCDIYSRIIHGTSTSLSVGIIVTALVAFIGIVFGGLAGFYGGWIDSVLSRIGDIFFSIPYILAAVVIMSVLSAFANVWVISLAIGIFAWPATARVLRAEILRVKNADFVMAATVVAPALVVEVPLRVRDAARPTLALARLVAFSLSGLSCLGLGGRRFAAGVDVGGGRLGLAFGLLALGRPLAARGEAVAPILVALEIVVAVLAVVRPEVLRLGRHDDAIVVLGVLEIVLGHHRVARGLGVARQLRIFLGDMGGVTAHLHVRTVALVIARKRIGMLASTVAVARAVLVLAVGSHLVAL
jgi:hypothetical protein